MSRDLRRDAFRTLLAAALSALFALSGCDSREPPEPPNVVLITLDTTRPDHLGLYGYEGATSPHLDALAEASHVFERAYSTSSWTLPAHASLFTGKLPTHHGARKHPDGPVRLVALFTPEPLPADAVEAAARSARSAEDWAARFPAAEVLIRRIEVRR